MAKEYVDREAALSAIYSIPTPPPEAAEYDNEVQKRLKNLPAADVALVVHGRWVEENGYQTCSNCGDEHSWDEYRASFCECCGAKMDQEVGNG